MISCDPVEGRIISAWVPEMVLLIVKRLTALLPNKVNELVKVCKAPPVASKVKATGLVTDLMKL